MKDIEKKELTVDDLNSAFTRVEKVITTSLQLSDDTLDKIMEFNRQNNYEYIIKYDEYNLVDSRNIITLIRNDYTMGIRGGIGVTDSLIFEHKYKESK